MESRDENKTTKPIIRENAMNEQINMETGEITPIEKLNQVIVKTTRRADGTVRIQQDFSNCPTMAEQHTAHLTNLNYLIAKFKPDELAAYMAAREQHRREIVGHDFSKEPNLQQAKNVVYQSRQAFEELPDDVKYQFKNHLEFLKFIDNPANAAKMIKLGILTPKKIKEIQIPEKDTSTDANTKDDDVGGGRKGEVKANPSSKTDR